MTTAFQPKKRITSPSSTTAKRVKELFEQNQNTPLPFRLKGSFKYINTTQKTYWDIEGTIAGFCIPSWQKAVSGDGLQCMFFSEDKESGAVMKKTDSTYRLKRSTEGFLFCAHPAIHKPCCLINFRRNTQRETPAPPTVLASSCKNSLSAIPT